MTSSRLDRLFVLLETGSSVVTRSAAAKQLGEVQKLHPHELHTLLTRTATYLKSTVWETRVAAAEAVRAIVSNVPQWDPPGVECKIEGEHAKSLTNEGRLRFENFNMEKVLANSNCLMASEGKEFDCDEALSGVDAKERLARQRKILNAKLGLDIDMSGLLTNEDLATPDVQENSFKWDDNKEPLIDVIGMEAGLSCREMNRAKRKARQIGKQRPRESVDETCSNGDEPDKKRVKLEESKSRDESNTSFADGDLSESGDWPLEWFCDQISQELFSSSWETRHGCATALREILSVHGNGAGKSAYLSKNQMEEQHQLWLEDMAIRLLCVLALDRFGDFVSDAVVAPVRETCAQCLCAILKLMKADNCQRTLRVLLQLLEQKEWEARHGGLLGLKYLLAVRDDMIDSLLQNAFPHVLAGLADPVDDVGAVAAAALIPIAAQLIDLVPDALPQIIAKLWDLLAEQDELAAACNSFMGLLAAILSLPKAHAVLPPQPLNEVVPRLWPFLNHSASSVRKATLQTLLTLTQRTSEGVQLQWEAQLLQDALRHVYQRVLVEARADVRAYAENVWTNLVKNSGLVELLHAACPMVSVWLCLSMQATKLHFDPAYMLQARSGRRRTAIDGIANFDNSIAQPKWYIGGSETTPIAVRECNTMLVRSMTARMLGLLSCYIVKPAPGIDYTQETAEDPVECYVKLLLVYLQSKSALQRLMVGLVMAEWAKREPETPCPPALQQRLHHCLGECVYFDEIAVSFTRLAQETKDFVAMMRHYKVPIEAASDAVLTLDHIKQLTGAATQTQLLRFKLKSKIQESLEERRKSIQGAVSQTSSDQFMLSVSTLAALAGAVVRFHCLPDKLTPVVKPLMESIRRERDENLQKLTATHLADLLDQCRDRTPCPNEKILLNLCTFLRSDPEYTPVIMRACPGPSTAAMTSSASMTPTAATTLISSGNYNGIITLGNLQRNAERAAFRKPNSGGRGPGRPPTTDIPLDELFRDEDETQKTNQIQRRGATMALTEILVHFGPHLPDRLPKLWHLIIEQLVGVVDPAHFTPSDLYGRDADAEQLVWSLQVLEVTIPSIHHDLHALLMGKCLPRLCVLLAHPYRAVRHLCARCLAACARRDSVPTMEHLVQRVLPLLEAAESHTERQGAVEAIACIVDALQFEIVPYVVLLVVPLLGRMSDQDQCVRLMGTHSFATLVQLMPLDGGVPEPPALKGSALGEKRLRERQFLEQLLAPASIPDYVVPVKIEASLRSYQQAGVNWLAFLNRYRLHGILCDDMGLGKTLQSICILAGDTYARAQRYRETRAADATPLHSLVICPPTLIGHWVYEVEKFVSHKHLHPLQYNGHPAERERLRDRFDQYNLIVASYDIVRKDIAFLAHLKWNYVILDEGHVIKNGKTRTSVAIKKLNANHRLILSGTPIQNNVLELWSLFDFLMPGFLGTEKQFTATYSKPILASRDPRCSPKEQEAGALAMEALHRQVLPFLLRRMKEDVLDDLPPKITQDYYCELSPLQEQLYEDFAKSQAHHTLQHSLATTTTTPSVAATASMTSSLASARMPGNTHIFQALRYLQNVCNHPKLVLNAAHPQYAQIKEQLREQKSQLDDIQHSAKLPALKQLLQDCGIGSTDPQSTILAINQHRALVFCQLKAMLDIIENDLFKRFMPSVTYLRLDGSIPPAQRHSVVTRFNNDPSIDVLLLTTQVGGLGLNLTGADTVIFVEHDWNPMKDLQAMDRAHRIGQRKVVNIYRLITRNTLEEKIMGLQKFKMQTANTVISGENSHLESMGTDQLLNLFSNKPCEGATLNNSNKSMPGGGVKAILDSLPDLWDQKQYEDEYDLSQFMVKLST